MNTFWILVGVAILLCGLGTLAFLALHGLAFYQKHLDEEALGGWDKFYEGDPDINPPELPRGKK